MKKSTLRTLFVTGVSLFATAGAVFAASTRDVTTLLGGKTGDYFDINGTLLVDSIKVGAQGVGGVTYFNGTIANSTTGSNNTGNPVTIGDDLRVDGTIHRGSTDGPGDTMPLKLNDDVNVYGNLTMSSGKTLDLTGATITGLSVTAAQISDVTRRIGLPLNTFLDDADGTPTALSNSTVPKLTYTANQGLSLQYGRTEITDIGTQFTVPADYVSGGVIKAIVDLSSAIVTDWDLDFQLGISHTGTAAWATSMANETAINLPDSPGKPHIITMTPTNQSSITAGDTIFLDMFPANNSGAGEPNLNISNVWFEYTASQ